MILTIIARRLLFGYMLTSLYLTQTLAQAIADMHTNRWVLMALINCSSWCAASSSRRRRSS